MPSKAYRRLFFDIETSLQEAVLWGTGKQYVGPDNITTMHGIICIAWKWEGSRYTKSLTWDENLCDKAMLEAFIPIMHSADEIVGHNDDRFDTPWIRTRCLKHGIAMSPEFVSLDTLKASRSKFRFPIGNRLDSVARYLDLGRKLPTGLGLWKAVLAGDEAAKRKMVNYCKHDVKLLESVWTELAPYLPVKANRARNGAECPECQSRNTTVQKHRVTAAGSKRVQIQCQDCGKYISLPQPKYEKAIAAAGGA